MLLGWDGVDGLEDLGDDLVGIGLGVGATIFKIALVTVLDEVYGQADGSAAIGKTIVELVDGLGLVQAGEAQMVVRAIDLDVLLDVFLEGCHEGFEVFLAADFADVLGGEVGVHAGAVPVALDRLAMQLEIDIVLLDRKSVV